jgi:uncharacterized protein (DUF486 family)
MAKDVPTMKVWWVLSVILVMLMLVLLVFAWIGSLPFVLQVLSVVCVALWVIALLYFVVRRR